MYSLFSNSSLKMTLFALYNITEIFLRGKGGKIDLSRIQKRTGAKKSVQDNLT